MIGTLLVGALLGSAGTFFLSQKARENAVVAKYATQDFLDNEEIRRIFIEMEINRLINEGKLMKLVNFKYEPSPLDYTHFQNYKFWKEWCERNGFPYTDPCCPTKQLNVNVPILNDDAIPSAT